MVPSKGGIRRKYGGSTNRHGVRKGDLLKSKKIIPINKFRGFKPFFFFFIERA
jgi:hypothetical protein